MVLIGTFTIESQKTAKEILVLFFSNTWFYIHAVEKQGTSHVLYGQKTSSMIHLLQFLYTTTIIQIKSSFRQTNIEIGGFTAY